MTREQPVAYDYQAKGAADFKAGRKDERLYANPENHGASYRRGWQDARRQADAGQDSRPGPDPVKPKETPGVKCVSCDNGRIQLPSTDFEERSIECHACKGTGRRQPKPEDWNGVPGSVSIVQPDEPAPAVTREQVRLRTGEDKPKKPKPPAPDQLAFF